MFLFNNDFRKEKVNRIRNKMESAEVLFNIVLMFLACILTIVYIISEAVHGRFSLSSLLMLVMFIGLLFLFIRKRIKKIMNDVDLTEEPEEELEEDLLENSIYEFSCEKDDQGISDNYED